MLESPLDYLEMKLINRTGNQPWIFIRRTDAEDETPILWPPDVKSWLIGKDPDAGEDWGQEKGVTENEMIGWHCWLNGNETEQTVGHSEGQGKQSCRSPWSCRELGMAKQMNKTAMTSQRHQGTEPLDPFSVVWLSSFSLLSCPGHWGRVCFPCHLGSEQKWLFSDIHFIIPNPHRT